MTNFIASLLDDVHSSKARQTLFRDGNCFQIAFPVSLYSLWQMLLRVVADGSTSCLRNTLYDRHSLKFDLAFQRI
jgi:hypothetical protein